eukprot:scaffold26765_cov43-Phaeocystis_antarctica.AAC.1
MHHDHAMHNNAHTEAAEELAQVRVLDVLRQVGHAHCAAVVPLLQLSGCPGGKEVPGAQGCRGLRVEGLGGAASHGTYRHCAGE